MGDFSTKVCPLSRLVEVQFVLSTRKCGDSNSVLGIGVQL
nr:MAG TPA: hypothetical protein [Caudoviricetes sp.]